MKTNRPPLDHAASLEALLDAVLADSGEAASRLAESDFEASAELASLLAAEPGAYQEIESGKRMALLAALYDGQLDDDGRTQLDTLFAASPAEVLEALASFAYLDDVLSREIDAAADLPEAAISGSRGLRLVPPVISPVNRPIQEIPRRETFISLAAASGAGDDQAIKIRSQAGRWLLEVFVGYHDPEAGYLILTVEPEHRENYEGRPAKVWVQLGDQERVLVEDVVRDGQISANISLAGLDLSGRDAVNIVFGTLPEEPPRP